MNKIPGTTTRDVNARKGDINQSRINDAPSVKNWLAKLISTCIPVLRLVASLVTLEVTFPACSAL